MFNIFAIFFSLLIVVLTGPLDVPFLSKRSEAAFKLFPNNTAVTMRAIYGVLIILIGLLDFIPSNFIQLSLSFVKNHIFLFISLIFVFALLPPVIAFFERRKDSECASKKYVLGNLTFNVLGAIATGSSILAASMIIEDDYGLYRSQLSAMTTLVLAVCVWIAFTFQRAEQKAYSDGLHSVKSDKYDPSLKWKNQILNVVNLVNVYFFSLFSGVLVFIYARYCFVHGYRPKMSIWIYIFLSIILLFFYACALNPQKHIYLFFLEAVPLMLFLLVLWFTWFDVSKTSTAIFIGAHLIVYITLLLMREKKEKLLKVYNIVVPIVVILLLAFILVTSQNIERTTRTVAEKYLGLIDQKDHITEIERMKYFDAVNNDIDSSVLIDYMNINFEQELKRINLFPATIESLNSAVLNAP